jgi:hypothetical protein
MVGEVTGTPGLWDFGTPEDLRCSVVERDQRERRLDPRGEIIELWEIETSRGFLCRQKEALNAEASNAEFPLGVYLHKEKIHRRI